MRILFVCLGNICRSPTAEGVMKQLVADAGLQSEIEVESAGTGGWHVGHPPDERATGAAAARGIELLGEARRVIRRDFDDFDLLIAMDRSNRDALLALAPDAEARRKVFLLREFGEGAARDVPDPYYGGEEGFEHVLDIVERSCEALLEEVRERIAA
ncbi:MAG TPA: low molecular weight protein-tyrosine-phosphatase [Solirubrobacterales bacterium]|nr:low molecular weight protein-tyrosine-phosphatase [Solirubrobacterales bacterium]